MIEKKCNTSLEEPISEDRADEGLIQCSICGDRHKESIMHGFEVKGKKKYICQGCADTVHGLV